MEYKDYYKIMGVPRDASDEDIKRAHRKLARRYHPDVSQEKDAEAKFKELNEAHEVLRDPEKRAAYDQLGQHWRAGQDFRPPPDWNAGAEHPGRGFEWTFRQGGAPGAGRNGSAQADFSDFFETLFGQGFAPDVGDGSGAQRSGRSTGTRRSAPRQAGEDHHAKILIDLEDAYTGAQQTVVLRAPELQPDGRVTEREHQISFDVPKGIRPGQQIRLTGQGGPGAGGGPAGDLYLEVDFRPRSAGRANYRVDKHDVYLDLPIAPWEAALGAAIEAPTPTSTVEVTVPPGSASGRKLRLKGRGIPSTTPGDFYFVLQIVQPAADSDKAKRFYEGMAEQFKAFNPRKGFKP